MQPTYRILADNQDITAAIRDRLLLLRLTDAAGIQSDTAEIRLDDRDHAIALPATGASLDIALGYRESGLASMGKYTVDEMELEGPPDVMAITAKAADMKRSMKEPRTQGWDQVQLGDVVTTVATQHDLAAVIDPDLAGIMIPHLDQTAESDMHLLRRLASDYGATMKIANGRLIFMLKGAGKTASGKALPGATITRSDVTGWRVTLADRGKYGAVTTTWQDVAGAETRAVTAGAGEPVFTIRKTYADQMAAEAAAKAKLAEFARGEAKLSLTLPGRADLFVEAPLSVTGIRPGADGDWLIERVTHTLDTSGWITRVEASTSKK